MGVGPRRSLVSVVGVAAVLAAIPGGIRLYTGFVSGSQPYLLTGLGFFAVVALLLVSFRRQPLYLAGLLYSGLLGVVWYAESVRYSLVGLFEGTVQVVLLVLILYLYFDSRSSEGYEDRHYDYN